MYTTRRRVALCTVYFLILAVSNTAHAYVDPGSGSVIVTTILGIAAAIGYTFRKYLYKVKRLFGGKESTKSRDRFDGDS